MNRQKIIKKVWAVFALFMIASMVLFTIGISVFE